MPLRRLVATVASGRDARRLVEALSMHGVDGGRIRVLDPAHGDGGRPTSDDRATDASVVRRLATRLGGGVLLGAVAGAMLGALVLGLVSGEPTVAVAGAFAGAIAGGGLGALVGLQSTPSMATAWEDANAPGPGARHVVVTDVDPAEDAELRSVMTRYARQVRIDEEA